MLHLQGIPVSPGYASGLAVVYDLGIERRIEMPQRWISDSQVASECDRLDDALEHSAHDLRQLEISASVKAGLAESTAVMSAQSVMASDIAKLVKQHIGEELVNVEQALHAVVSEFVSRFAEMENRYFREREQDVRDVGQRLMRHCLRSMRFWTLPTLLRLARMT